MSDRLFRLIFGSALLLALYFKQDAALMVMVAILLFETITNRMLLKMIGRAYGGNFGPCDLPFNAPTPRFKFEAERFLRLSMAIMLLVGIVFPEILWFFPWIVGFGLLAAGLSGICPMTYAFKMYVRLA